MARGKGCTAETVRAGTRGSNAHPAHTDNREFDRFKRVIVSENLVLGPDVSFEQALARLAESKGTEDAVVLWNYLVEAGLELLAPHAVQYPAVMGRMSDFCSAQRSYLIKHQGEGMVGKPNPAYHSLTDEDGARLAELTRVLHEGRERWLLAAA
jgi:hypothetical protein